MNPRTRRVRRVILDAAGEILLRQGAANVTAARVAELADVARTTIYRHWPDSASLLLATVDDFGTPDFEHTTEGDLSADLPLTLERLSARLTKRKTRLVFSALASQAHHDETFADAQQAFMAHLAAPIQFVLQAAIERGQLAPDCDCELQAGVLAAPILHQHFLAYGELTDELIQATTAPWLEAHRIG